MTVILGIDPGSQKTGWGVVERADARRVRARGCGVIRTRKGAPLPERLAFIYGELQALCREHEPDAVAVEQVFVRHHPRSALILGHARGVALLAASHSGGAVFEYAPADIKRSVTGSGRADKAQINKMVVQLLGLREVPAEDAADALAAALAHALRRDLAVPS